MLIIDLYEKIKTVGVFSTFFGIADLHLLIDSEDPAAYQPLDHDAYSYLKYCAEELQTTPRVYGKIYSFGAGDWTELERSSVRKAKRAALHKNDSRAEDAIHKQVLNHNILPKIKVLTRDTRFIGGVAGNHLIEFSDDSRGTGYVNSEAYLIQRLGGRYCGEGKMLINYHIQLGNQRCLKKILITHGAKGGSKTAVMNQLKQIHSQYGHIDLIICAHAHDPFTGFFSRYKLPDESTGRMKKVETLVMCLGSTRDGEKAGDGINNESYDDYTERCNYTPFASRYPVAMFMAYKPMANNRTLDVKIRPLTM